MQHLDIYTQIARRTGGDIYMGVVGPVRTGKSTFIRRFMEEMVLPSMEASSERDRIRDTLPQSGSGRTIMTSQIQFVPEEAAEIAIGEDLSARVRLVDSVGYPVEEALGAFEEDSPRMVMTPWYEEPIPFAQAAREGTRRVIREHASMTVVVTSDGSATALSREQLAAAEDEVIRETASLGKPFVIVVNSLEPEGEAARSVREELRSRYDAAVIALNAADMQVSDMTELLQLLIYEFPARELSLYLPSWVKALPREHWLRRHLAEILRQEGANLHRLRDTGRIAEAFARSDYVTSLQLTSIDPQSGSVEAQVLVPDTLFYSILSEASGTEIRDQGHLMEMMAELVHAKKEYDRMAGALDQVRSTGYGVIAPSMEELTLQAPEMVRQGTQFGVRLRASAPSWHILRVDVAAEVSPAVGTEKQSEKLAASLLDAFRNDPDTIWDTEIFGRSLADLVRDSLSGKLRSMPEATQEKMRQALSRIVGDEGGGLMVLWL